MGLYPDSPEIDAITGDIKKRISVGICGSFSKENKKILTDLKGFLKEKGYNHVFTADDFPSDQPRVICSDAKYENAYDKSMELVNHCDMCIIFFFISKTDPEINQSALLEIQELCSKGRQNVIVLLENGFTLRSNLKGIKRKSSHNQWWGWDDFSREKIEDCFIHVKQVCHNFILERFMNCET